MNTNYRIQNENGYFMNAGTFNASWFSLEYAKQLVNYDKGQRIVEICMHTGRILWEVL